MRRNRRAREILGVDERAGAPEIKRAFWGLAMRYHPDRNPGDSEAEQTFASIKRAYEYLLHKSADPPPGPAPGQSERPGGKYGRNSWGYFCQWREAFMDEFVGEGSRDESED